MTDRQIFIGYLVVTGVCAAYMVAHSFISRRSPAGAPVGRRARASYLEAAMEIPVAIAVAFMWPLGLLCLGLYLVLKGLGVQPRSRGTTT